VPVVYSKKELRGDLGMQVSAGHITLRTTFDWHLRMPNFPTYLVVNGYTKDLFSDLYVVIFASCSMELYETQVLCNIV
jgi:hypothetical protein